MILQCKNKANGRRFLQNKSRTELACYLIISSLIIMIYVTIWVTGQLLRFYESNKIQASRKAWRFLCGQTTLHHFTTIQTVVYLGIYFYPLPMQQGMMIFTRGAEKINRLIFTNFNSVIKCLQEQKANIMLTTGCWLQRTTALRETPCICLAARTLSSDGHYRITIIIQS